jgi:hypothetical protein
MQNGDVGVKINTREELKRIHRILDPFFVEGEMDFGIEVWWEVRRMPLMENVKM